MSAEDRDIAKIVEVIRNGGNRNGSSFNGSIFKTLSAVAILATLVFMARGEIKPLGERINGVENRMQRIEQRIEYQLAQLDEKLQIEVGHTQIGIERVEGRMEEDDQRERNVAASLALLQGKNERTLARLGKVDLWLAWWNKTVPRINARQDAKIEAIEACVKSGQVSP